MLELLEYSGWYERRSPRPRKKEYQLDVGRQYDNRVRITVQSRLTPNIGLDDGGVAHPEIGTIHTRLGGQPVQAGEDDI